MDWAYSIELSANEESVPIGDFQVMMAKTIHPGGWEFWQGREVLFGQLVTRVWYKVSLEFPGKAAAAGEVMSTLKSWNEPRFTEFTSQLSENQLYHIYLAAVHGRLLHQAIANGEIERLEHNPTGTLAYDPLVDVAEMVINSADRIPIRELANYLKRFHVELKKERDESIAGVLPDRREKQAEGMPEIRGQLILKQLELMGYDPLKMEYKNGKSGVKSEVRERIWELQLQEFIHRTKGPDRASFDDFFRKAWEWLSKNNLIDNQKN